MGDKPRVLLLHSEMSPYRLPLFEELAQKVDLEVYFCQAKSKKRLWNASTEGYSFKSKILKCINVGPLIINYLLPFELLSKCYQIYIIDDDPRLTFSKLSAFLTAKLLKKPVIIWSGAIEEGYHNKIENLVNRYLFVPIRHLVYHYADAFVAYGQKTVNFLVKNGVPKEKIHIGTQAVPQASQIQYQINKKELKGKLGFSGKKIILFVGYFTKRKGIFELIEAFKQLNRDDTILIMAGAGKEERRLKTLTAGRNDIYFPGYVTGKVKANYYGIADIFVLPTFVDPWGLVINEAMTFGLPIITTTGAGASELIKGNGIVIEPGDVEALRSAMEYLLDNDEVRSEMGAKSKEIIKNYTIQGAAENIFGAIRSVLNNPY